MWDSGFLLTTWDKFPLFFEFDNFLDLKSYMVVQYHDDQTIGEKLFAATHCVSVSSVRHSPILRMGTLTPPGTPLYLFDSSNEIKYANLR